MGAPAAGWKEEHTQRKAGGLEHPGGSGMCWVVQTALSTRVLSKGELGCVWEFPGCPVVRTQRSQCQGPGIRELRSCKLRGMAINQNC